LINKGRRPHARPARPLFRFDLVPALRFSLPGVILASIALSRSTAWTAESGARCADSPLDAVFGIPGRGLSRCRRCNGRRQELIGIIRLFLARHWRCRARRLARGLIGRLGFVAIELAVVVPVAVALCDVAAGRVRRLGIGVRAVALLVAMLMAALPLPALGLIVGLIAMALIAVDGARLIPGILALHGVHALRIGTAGIVERG
jgi:hypothetical protein